jgi:Leucine-rich repeat (LRR) protein
VEEVTATFIRNQKHAIKYGVKYDEFYIKSAKIYQSDFKLVHNHRGSVVNITTVEFDECTFVEIPRAEIILDLVKNLTSLFITESNLTKISREDLRGLGSLKELYLIYNSIEQLPKGLFEFTPNLEIVSFWQNRIKEIDADILDPLKNLKHLDLLDNISISAVYSSIADYPGKVTLAQLKEEIRQKCAPIDKIIAEMRKEIDTLKNDNVDLKKDKKDIADLKRENAGLKRKFDELETNYNNLSVEFKKLKQMKENQIIYDFTVSINGKDFRVNKEILTSNSPVFKELIDKNRDADHLELQDISEKTFEEILNFMHSKNSPNNTTNLLELYAASGRLQMKELMDATAKILMEIVTPDNAPDIIKLCNKYAHEELGKKAFNELKKKFQD